MIKLVKLVGRFVYGLMPNGNAVEAQFLAREGFLNAPSEFKDEDKESLFDICNGCGAGNALFDFVPDNFWFLYIGHACHIHDWMYEMGDTEEDRKIADDVWLENMYKIIEMDSSWCRSKHHLKKMARGYYEAVKIYPTLPLVEDPFKKKTYLSSQLRFNKANGYPSRYNVDDDTICDIFTGARPE